MKPRRVSVLLFIFALLSCSSPATVAGGSKDVYLDFMEQAISSYTAERIDDYIAEVEKEGISEHGFARLTANMGILMAHGRKLQNKECFVRMMDLCAEWVPVANQVNRKKGTIGNDFAVKEICCCLKEIEQAGLYPQEQIDAWKSTFARMKARDIYYVQPEPLDTRRAYNWAVFGATSECARLYTGIGGDRSYADTYLGDQLRWFDAEGRYQDPHQPEAYDVVTRLQYMASLHFGYDGPFRPAIEEQLLKSAPLSLMIQSASGELSYGGRSNQFLHNDSCMAALYEYYATWMKQRGDMKMASRFKAAAIRARHSLSYWLGKEPVSHIKNRFPADSGFGCENYAYFNKYMITMGSWAYLAYLFADDSIEPSTRPEPASTYVTTDGFHRIMMNAGGYTVQFDINAQKEYDSNGIGRFQKEGASPVVALSVPCPASAKPKTKADIPAAGPLAIAPLWKKYEIVLAKPGRVVLSDGKDGRWDVRLSRKGLHMVLTGEGEQTMTIPVIESDGENSSLVECAENGRGSVLKVTFDGSKATYRSNATTSRSEGTYANRNGHLQKFVLKAPGRIVVDAEIGDQSLNR